MSPVCSKCWAPPPIQGVGWGSVAGWGPPLLHCGCRPPGRGSSNIRGFELTPVFGHSSSCSKCSSGGGGSRCSSSSSGGLCFCSCSGIPLIAPFCEDSESPAGWVKFWVFHVLLQSCRYNNFPRSCADMISFCETNGFSTEKFSMPRSSAA